VSQATEPVASRSATSVPLANQRAVGEPGEDQVAVHGHAGVAAQRVLLGRVALVDPAELPGQPIDRVDLVRLVGEDDQVAGQDRSLEDRAASRVAPPLGPVARVDRDQVAVVGADVEPVALAGHRRRRAGRPRASVGDLAIDHRPRAHRAELPLAHHLAGPGRQAVERAVVRADEQPVARRVVLVGEDRGAGELLRLDVLAVVGELEPPARRQDRLADPAAIGRARRVEPLDRRAGGRGQRRSSRRRERPRRVSAPAGHFFG
jgi:hypothetical protein